MNTEICLINKINKSVFLNVYQYYIYEMSLFYEKYLGNSGLFDFDTNQFDKYWLEDQHWPYFIMVEGNIAGFCLLRQISEGEQRYDIEQYFVLNKYQRKGIGASTLEALVNNHPGKWQVRVLPNNLSAICFWEASIAQISESGWVKTRKQELGSDMHVLYFEKNHTQSP